MSVAPSFENFERLSEPYYDAAKKKSYIKVRNPKTGTERVVRWYEETAVSSSSDLPRAIPNLKKIRGFSQGPITVITNATKEDSYCHSINARYAVGIGWYFVSEESLPADFPEKYKLVELTWDEFKIDETHMKKPEVLTKIISEKVKRKEFIANN